MQSSKLEPLQEGKPKDHQVSTEQFQVERILQRGNVKGVIHYLVKWKNYPEAEATWQPISNLSQCQKAINDFESLIKKLSLIKEDQIGQSQLSRSKNNSEKSRSKSPSNKKIKSLKNSMIKSSEKQSKQKEKSILKVPKKIVQKIEKQENRSRQDHFSEIKKQAYVPEAIKKSQQQKISSEKSQKSFNFLQQSKKSQVRQKVQLENNKLKQEQESAVTKFPVNVQKVQKKQNFNLQEKVIQKSLHQKENTSSGIEEVSTNQSRKQIQKEKLYPKIETSLQKQKQKSSNIFKSSNSNYETNNNLKRDFFNSEEEDDTLKTMQIPNKKVKVQNSLNLNSCINKKTAKFQIYFKWVDYTQRQESNIKNQNHSSICKINQFAKNTRFFLQKPSTLEHLRDRTNRNRYLISMQTLKKMTDYEYLENQELCQSCKLELIKLNCEYNQECWENVLKNCQKNAYKQKIVLNQIFDYYIEAFKLFEVLSLDIAIYPLCQKGYI